MGDSNDVPNSVWKELMVAAQNASDGSHQEPRAMSTEDRTFIENALGHAYRKVDPVRHMKSHIETLQALQNPTVNELELVEETVDALENITCQIDCAFDFCTLGGLTEVQRLMECKCDEIRGEVLRLIPTIAQNNPRVQNVVVECGLLGKLMTLASNDAEKPKIRIRALSGISSIVRAHDAAFSQFRRQNGFIVLNDIFRKAIETGNDLVANKVTFVLCNIAYDLGYQASVDHGVVSALIRVFGALPLSLDAVAYLRAYISENVNLERIDNDNHRIISTALQSQLQFEREREDSDQDAIKEINGMLSRLTKHMKS